MKMRNTLIAGLTASFLGLNMGMATAADQPAQNERTAGQVINDSVITTKVKAALVGDSRTKAHQISVTTHEGVVQLNGTVDTADAKLAASEVASSVEGVRSVENKLGVKS